MIAVVDYGMGNLRSVQKALEKAGGRAQITSNPADILAAEKVVLPGVGAIQPAVQQLDELELTAALGTAIKNGKPFLGICLGFQLLFETSNEGGNVKGLGFLKGTVERFSALKVPHMGWNQLNMTSHKCPLFKNIENKTNVYFCHSYFVKPANPKIISTTTDYGVEFASSVCDNNVFGVQFHPEKSQNTGLTILKNFVEL